MDVIKGWCLIAPSGAFSSFDSPSTECRLLNLVMAKLASFNIASLVPEMPLRSSHEPASVVQIDERTRRLRTVHDEYLQTANVPTLWVGFSLGAHCLLGLASEPQYPPPVSLLLIGCVLERPVHLMCHARRVIFLYSERDHITYRGDDDTVGEVLRPEEYGPWSASHLILRRSQECHVETWTDCGHLLIRTDSPAYDAVANALAIRVEELLS